MNLDESLKDVSDVVALELVNRARTFRAAGQPEIVVQAAIFQALDAWEQITRETFRDDVVRQLKSTIIARYREFLVLADQDSSAFQAVSSHVRH